MELIDSLITAYGFIAIATITAVAGMVWLISHFVAKPGGKVSVLWGLATYDRRDSNEVTVSYPHRQSNSQENDVVSEAKRVAFDASDASVIATIDDSLLLDAETQRGGGDLAVYKGGRPLNQLAIVTLILESQSNVVIPLVNLHLKRKRPGEIISALPQILGNVEFQNSARVTQLGLQIILKNIHPGERFRLQMLTDGLRATDFHLVQESCTPIINLIIEKSEDWQP